MTESFNIVGVMWQAVEKSIDGIIGVIMTDYIQELKDSNSLLQWDHRWGESDLISCSGDDM